MTAVLDARGVTTLPVLEGEGPLALRRVSGPGPAARVCVIGAMSAPLGGDALRIEVEVQPGAALHITSAAATVALPGSRPGVPATYDVRLTVADDAELHWLPEPLIAAAGSNLHMTTRVHLAPTARLVLREEQILGRAGEEPGHLTSRLTARIADTPLLDQETAFGPGAPAWDGPALLAGYRASGQLLSVAPDGRETGAAPDPHTPGESVTLALAAPNTTLTTALAPHGLALRRHLDAAALSTPQP
ncbi:urease accessory protein UreD [Streptomyces boninensis]|uniref:urease accessory protein UreD n=1 Tax=Streptomyces boninensis TaxID=2039455 RepID=UPI003B2277FA